jgi:hypothetical protein
VIRRVFSRIGKSWPACRDILAGVGRSMSIERGEASAFQLVPCKQISIVERRKLFHALTRTSQLGRRYRKAGADLSTLCPMRRGGFRP